MLLDPDKTPAFFKILLSAETFTNKMQLPSCFIKENKKILTKNCLLKTDVAEMWWEVEIVREKANYFICEGDWPQFVLHHQLKQGDVLLFFLVEKSMFHVQLYTKKCCKNIVQRRPVLCEELSSSSAEESTGPSKRARKMVASNTEKRSLDMPSNDESKYEDDPYYNNLKRENASLDGSLVILDHSTENLRHGPLAEMRKRKRQGDGGEGIPINVQTNATIMKEEENDIAVNLQFHANVTEEEDDDIPVHPQTNANIIEVEKSHEIYEGGKELEQQPNIGTDKDVGKDNSGSEEDAPNYSSRHSLVNFDCEDPYFEIVIKKSHTNFMTIPKRFAARTKIFEQKNMRLVNEEGKEWGVKIEYNGHAIHIKGGWAKFRRENKLAVGEACRFKLIQGHAVNVLQVHKIPTPGSLQYY